MPGILGGGPPQGGILGLLAQQGQQQGPPPAMAYDPGAMIWREMMQAMASNKGGHPLAFMAPQTKAFSPELAAMLGPQFQQKQGR